MATYSLDLLFFDPKLKGFPGSPRAQIYVKTYSSDKKGTINLGPICVGLSEIEAQCDRLIKEVESIRKKAQRKFKTK
jgi:hypothetical protein